MKKTSLKYLLLVAVVSLGIIACTKQIKNEPQADAAATTSASVVTPGSSSVFPLSNYDGAGIMHNDGLNYTITTPGYSHMPFDQQMNTVVNYFAENQIEADLNLPVTEIEADLDATADMDPQTFGSHIIATTASQPVWQQHISRIIDVVVSSDDNAPGDVVSSQLRMMESRIMNNALIKPEDKNVILQFSSIVRNSQEYWKNFADNQQMIGRFNANACWDCIKRNWKKLALSDGWGFITGLLKGGPKAGVISALAKSAGALWKHCRQPCFW